MAAICGQVQVGQKAALKELEHGFELTLLAGDQPGSVVTEVAGDYIEMEDAAAGVVTRVPLYLIKSVGTDTPVSTATPEVLPSAA